MSLKKGLYLIAAVSAILTGSLSYIIARPETLLMFRWIDAIGLHDRVAALRHSTRELSLTGPLIFSAPFALWLLSYLLCIRIIWSDHSSKARHFWFWMVPCVSLLSELLQAVNLCPGTFDKNDCFALLAATLIVRICP